MLAVTSNNPVIIKALEQGKHSHSMHVVEEARTQYDYEKMSLQAYRLFIHHLAMSGPPHRDIHTVPRLIGDHSQPCTTYT
jgi:hypothetical protein